MQYASVEISLVALLPTLLLCWYIYEKDRVEKEPVGLLSLLFLVGGIAFIPAFFAERGIMTLVDGWFSFTHSAEGIVQFDSVGAQLGHAAVYAFIGVALIETAVKWLLLVLITHKSRHFNCLFDGLVYACFVSLGFAAFENVCFAWLNGWDTLALRLATSVPCHLLIGTLMGYCYTLWHMVAVAQSTEKELVADGKLPETRVSGAGWLLAASFVIPTLTHGLYILSGSFHSTLIDILFYTAVGALFILCFIGIHLLSDKDRPTENASFVLLLRKHPTADAAALRGTPTEKEADDGE